MIFAINVHIKIFSEEILGITRSDYRFEVTVRLIYIIYVSATLEKGH